MKKKKRPIRRPSKRTSAPKESRAGSSSDTYSNFGPLGPSFQGLMIERWKLAAAEWRKLRRSNSRQFGDLPKSYSETFSRNIGLARYFLIQLLVCAKRKDAKSKKELRSEVVALWDSVIRHCFAQPLACAAEVFATARIEERCSGIIQCYSYAVSKTDPAFDLTKCCYGPFTQRETDYVLAHETRIIEGGCGAGYCIAQFNRLGIDAIGFDENLYGLSDGSDSAETKKLVDQGEINVADQSELADDIFRDRTLMISWPISTVPYAVEILRRYTELGGKRFILKFGGFLAFGSRAELRTISNFFTLLSESWKQLQGDDVPEYRPKLVENNLFVFERR
jgi:hypothetical protein